MMEEIWKDIKGYEGLYQVSNLGRVKSLPRIRNNQFGNSEIILKQGSYNGYNHIILLKDGIKKRFSVHRLVAIAFIPNPNNLPCVNHKDENKTNNTVSNLEWCSYKQNANWGTRNDRMLKARNETSERWSEKVVEQYTLDGEFVAEYPSAKEAERQTNIRQNNISNCCNKKIIHNYITKTAGGYKWRFKYELQ